ncbi:hypothetical protein BD408DRAFT_412765 [Parasitella parasitica]|nr:hypothetical protein BD408DRAFT_412765 [Parasitella parasitica]
MTSKDKLTSFSDQLFALFLLNKHTHIMLWYGIKSSSPVRNHSFFFREASNWLQINYKINNGLPLFFIEGAFSYKARDIAEQDYLMGGLWKSRQKKNLYKIFTCFSMVRDDIEPTF